METTTFDSGEKLSDHVPEDATVEEVVYVGDSETVKYDTGDGADGGDGERSDKTRSGLYREAKRMGLDVTWSGEGADTKEEIETMIAEETESDSE